MSPTRVMIVDDAVVVRHILSDTLKQDPEIEIIDTARDGKDALAKLERTQPDVLILDVEMPNMDGIETLAEVKQRWPQIKVIMFSTLTSRGAAATMDALMAGADDYVTKPANVSSISEAVIAINNELRPRIKALHRPARVHQAGASAAAPHVFAGSAGSAGFATGTATGHAARTGRPGVRKGFRPIELIVVAVSTGGPNALAELLPQLPPTLSVPIAIVQHIPPMFSKALADRLNSLSALSVREAAHGESLRSGQVVLAPGGMHLTVGGIRGALTLGLNSDPPENSCRPAADVLFRSAVATCNGNVLGIVLTGMGSDGTKGAAAIVEAGGEVIRQDEASSVVWGMPGSLHTAGVPADEYPLSQLATEITTRVASRGR